MYGKVKVPLPRHKMTSPKTEVPTDPGYSPIKPLFTASPSASDPLKSSEFEPCGNNFLSI